MSLFNTTNSIDILGLLFYLMEWLVHVTGRSVFKKCTIIIKSRLKSTIYWSRVKNLLLLILWRIVCATQDSQPWYFQSNPTANGEAWAPKHRFLSILSFKKKVFVIILILFGMINIHQREISKRVLHVRLGKLGQWATWVILFTMSVRRVYECQLE